MKQETQNKFAAILAAAQQGAGVKESEIKNAIWANEVKNEDINKAISLISDMPKEYDNLKDITEAANSGEIISLSNLADLVNKPSKMKHFKIIWQEGSGKYDGREFTTWNAANDAMTAIYNEHSGERYLKVKINVLWEDGSEITDRADCSDSAGDFCPKRGTIGEYLKKQNSVMYKSTLQKGDRVKLSFEDDKITQERPQPKYKESKLSSPPEPTKPTGDNYSILDFLGIQEEKQPELKIIDYSEKAVAVIGETKQIKDKLKQLGGRFNKFLTCGAGWIFSKRDLLLIESELNLKLV